MTDLEAEAMLAALTKHYGEPVLPLGRFCDAIRTWFRCIQNLHRNPETGVMKPEAERDAQGGSYAHHLRYIQMDIEKSSLLYRMLYRGEKLRETKCPIHDGTWQGIMACPHGCDETGWLPPEGVIPGDTSPVKLVTVP